MRDGWRETTLGQVATATTSQVPAATSGLPYYGLEHFDSGSPRISRSGDSAAMDGAGVTVSPGDVLFSKLRPYLNKVAVAGESAVASTEVLVYRPVTTELDASYLALLLRDARAVDYAVARSAGSRMPRTSAKVMAELPIALPPLDEQRRIVDLIAAVDDAVEAAEGEADASELAARAYRRGAMSVIPTKCRIADVARVVTGRTFKAEHQGHATGVVPYFRVSDMTLPGNERELVSPADWLDEDGVAAVKPVMCPPGTVVFPILGAALATEKRRVLGIEAGFVQHMIGLVPGPRVSTGWLLAVMSEVRLADISQKGAMPSVNQSLVGSIEMPLPDVDVQAQIVSDIAAMTDAADAARATAESLRTLRSNLLTVLLSGEHEIPSSYDVLLEEVA